MLSLIKMKNFKLKNKNGAYSIIETIIYVAMLTVLIGAIAYATMTLFSVYKKTKIVRSIEVSAVDSMDRIIRDIRNATSVNTAISSFNSSNGILALVSGTTTSRFYLSNQKIYVDENGTVLGALTSGSANVTSLIFRYIQATSSVAVKVEMTITSSSTPGFSKNFYNTAVLRGSY